MHDFFYVSFVFRHAWEIPLHSNYIHKKRVINEEMFKHSYFKKNENINKKEMSSFIQNTQANFLMCKYLYWAIIVSLNKFNKFEV